MNDIGLRVPLSGYQPIVCPYCSLKIENLPLRILKPKLLIVEGKDEEVFFNGFIDHLNIKDVQVTGIGGKDKIKPNLKALSKDSNFSQIISLGIIRDADKSAENAFKSVRESLIAAGLPSPKRALSTIKGPPKVTVMILPVRKRQGELEDLCLDAVADDSAMSCVDQYFDCLDRQLVDKPKKLSKAKVRVFLSSRKDPTLPLGISAEKGYWPLDNKAFADVQKFLQSL